MDGAIQTGSAGRPVGRPHPVEEAAVRITVGGGGRSAAAWPRSRGLGGSVLFAHGSGSRHSPRNPRVAERLQRGLGTLRWTCSPPTRRGRPAQPQAPLDIGLLSRRLLGAVGIGFSSIGRRAGL